MSFPCWLFFPAFLFFEVLVIFAVFPVTSPSESFCLEKPDDVCCRCADKVRRYDAEAMKLLGIETGMVLKWETLSKKAVELMTDAALFNAVCGDCEWHGICHENNLHGREPAIDG